MFRTHGIAVLIVFLGLSGCVTTPQQTSDSGSAVGSHCVSNLRAYLLADGGRWSLTGTRENGTTYKTRLRFFEAQNRLQGYVKNWELRSVNVQGSTVSFQFTSTGRKGTRTIDGTLSCQSDGMLAGYFTGPSSQGPHDFEDDISAVKKIDTSSEKIASTEAILPGTPFVLLDETMPALWIGDEEGRYDDVEEFKNKRESSVYSHTIPFSLSKVPKNARLEILMRSISPNCTDNIKINDILLTSLQKSGVPKKLHTAVFPIRNGFLKEGDNKITFSSDGCSHGSGLDDYLIHSVKLLAN